MSLNLDEAYLIQKHCLASSPSRSLFSRHRSIICLTMVCRRCRIPKEPSCLIHTSRLQPRCLTASKNDENFTALVTDYDQMAGLIPVALTILRFILRLPSFPLRLLLCLGPHSMETELRMLPPTGDQRPAPTLESLRKSTYSGIYHLCLLGAVE